MSFGESSSAEPRRTWRHVRAAQRVEERKLSPYTGADRGARLSYQAVQAIEDTVITSCSELFGIVAVSGINGDGLTVLFENLVGATVEESHRLFRNATAGKYFEGDPSLAQLRLHPQTPYHELGDKFDPEPDYGRIDQVLLRLIEPQREGLTSAAMQLRVEHMERLNTAAQIEAVPEDAPADRVGQTPEPEQGKAARRRAVVMPILEAKGWRPYRWERAAGVSRHVGDRYLAGETNLSSDSRMKLSTALDLPPRDLPL